jgi:uncharacterized protein (TIGR00255 family)
MSGFGRAEVKAKGFVVAVEIKTVNHRYLDLSLDLGDGLGRMDTDVRSWLSAGLSRGRVELKARLTDSRGPADAPALIDENAVRWYARKLSSLAKKTNLPPPRIESIVRLPGVVSEACAERPEAQVRAAMQKALLEAVEKVKAMRIREGRALVADISGRITTMERAVSAVRSEWVKASGRIKAGLEERIKSVLDRFIADKAPGVAKEMAGLVDKGDATEELTRLDSHFSQMRSTLKEGGAVGRRMDFLIQEMNRELNTTGSKAASAGISHMVVSMKEEAERIREQVQNLL